MNKADIHIRDKNGVTQYHHLHTAPASWAEMTREHLLFWAACIFSKLEIGLAARVMAAMIYQVPKKLFICIPPSDADALARSLTFLYEKNMLVNWLIPAIRCRLFKYHGPKNGLANITVHEFSLCEVCYERFQDTKNTEYLDTLAAILYRPCRFWGIDDDIRVKLTNHGYVKRAKRFKKLSEALKVAIYLNYEGCRHNLHAKYKDVFTPAAKGKKPIKNAQPIPWDKIIEARSNDIFGSLAQTEQANLHKFLSRLGTVIKEQREAEDKYKNR